MHRDLKPSNLFVQPTAAQDPRLRRRAARRFEHDGAGIPGRHAGLHVARAGARRRGRRAIRHLLGRRACSISCWPGASRFPGRELPKVLHQVEHEEPPPLGDSVPRELEAVVLAPWRRTRTIDRRGPKTSVHAGSVSPALSAETRKLLMSARVHSTKPGRGRRTRRCPRRAGSGRRRLSTVWRCTDPAGVSVSHQPRVGSDALAFERSRVMAVLEDLAAQRDD